MRAPSIALVLTLAACGGRATAPAWPKSAGVMAGIEGEDDGGESLEPRSHDGPAAALEAAPDLNVAEVLDVIELDLELPPEVTPTVDAPPPETGGEGEVIELEVQEITIEDESVRP